MKRPKQCEADLDALESLLDQCLIRRSNDRFTMLETIREYASEKLEESGEADELRQRHAEWVVALGREAKPWLISADQAQWLDRLQEEHGNLRTALNRFQHTEQTDLLLELLNSIVSYWRVRAGWREPQSWYEHALAASEGQRTDARAWLLIGAESGLASRGEYTAGEAMLDESLSIFASWGTSARSAVRLPIAAPIWST